MSGCYGCNRCGACGKSFPAPKADGGVRCIVCGADLSNCDDAKCPQCGAPVLKAGEAQRKESPFRLG